MLAYWIVAGVVTDVWEHLRPAGGLKLPLAHRARQLQRAFVGMSLAHLGVAVFIFGVTMVKSFEVERDVKMAVGDTTEAGGFTFTFQGVRQVEGANYDAAQGLVVVTKNGREIAQLKPEKRMYRVQQNPMTEAAIRTTLLGDQYVSLGQPVGDSAWVVRVYYKPFVTWIWGGCVLMALGGVLAISDRRYRTARQASRHAASTATAAA
jgi:cytochrome c-type biogenesis protein CcmF